MSNDVKEELEQIRKKEAIDFQRNILSRTLLKLLQIEKKSIYGSKKISVVQRLDVVLKEEFKNYLQERDAN